MSSIKSNWLFAIVFFGIFHINADAQITERARPASWKELVPGGRFQDLFEAISPIGERVGSTWGADGVIPRYTDNGIEDKEWSYWGGNMLKGDDGKFHLFVCRWREDSPKGHMEWPNSIVVHAVSEHSMGPFEVRETIGKGHNPEVFRLEDGRYVVYVIDGYYIGNSIDGPWEYGKFEFDPRDRPIIEGLSNLTFAQREDGSYLMVCRGGGVWFSKDGLSPYHQVTDKRVYPPVEGRFEDPVVWKDHIQYHLIVNDWYGRIAFYLRSKDGIHWKTDPGEAYAPGITKYTDGTDEDWFKYERIKILQDDMGRAIQANFAVIDTLKHEDKPNDNHSSKNIGIPLTVGRQLVLLNRKEITPDTKTIEVLVKAEAGFDPQKDMDITSLRFGASEEVNFGRGSRLIDSKPLGNDLVLVFEGKGNGFRKDNFAGKLIGKTKEGKLLFGFSRLPWVNYMEPALSAKLPEIGNDGLTVEVQNFGQVKSRPASVKVAVIKDGETIEIASGKVKSLGSFEKRDIRLKANLDRLTKGKWPVRVTVDQKGLEATTLDGELHLP